MEAAVPSVWSLEARTRNDKEGEDATRGRGSRVAAVVGVVNAFGVGAGVAGVARGGDGRRL